MPNRPRLPALIFTISALSCGTSISRLDAKGVRDLKCPESSIEWVPLDNAFRATGCGREAFYHWACRDMVCDYENMLTGLRERAGFAMGCPDSELQLHYLEGLSYGVSGCEKRLIFVYDCHARGGCTWRQEAASAP